MSTLTITNSLYVPPFTITETARHENSAECAASFIEFEVKGNADNYPIKLNYSSAPNGGSVSLDKLGTGTGIFKLALNNEEFFADQQSATGQMQEFSTIDLLLSNTGTTKFRLNFLSSDVTRNPITNNLVWLRCDKIEGDTSASTSISGGLQKNGATLFSISNFRDMWYSDLDQK